MIVDPGALEALPDLLAREARRPRFAVISDSNVAELYAGELVRGLAGQGLPAEIFTFPAGEAHKNREWWGRLTDGLVEGGFGRDAGVVALGGGVVGDLAGFVAATYMRGIPVVQVPTTLVAMIDSSVGGKTGVDHPQGKNLVGAFHPPELVVADPRVIRTLPRAERSQGMAEAVKHGAILDEGYVTELEEMAPALLAGSEEAVGTAVRRSVEIKGDVVSRDEREGGLRQILNFGHTVGHALEGVSDYSIPHGAAVSMGMVVEARLGEELGITQEGTARRLGRVLEGFGLPVTVPAGLSSSRILPFLRSDKKVRDGRLGMVLLERLGVVARGREWVHRIDGQRLEGLLNRAMGRNGPNPDLV